MNEAELLEVMVDRLLGEGVPPGVIGRAFELNVELVKERQSLVRKKKYGTDDLSEFIEHLRWAALEGALETVTSGSVSDKKAFLSVILGKEMAVNARRTPESQRKAVDTVMDLMESMKNGKQTVTAARSRFVATLERTNAEPGPMAPLGDLVDQDEVSGDPEA